MRVRAYLPPGFSNSNHYPALYLLHPWGEDEHFWERQIAFHQVANMLITAGAIPPFIAIMPQGDKSFFINAANPRGDYEMIMRFNPDFYQGALEGCGDYGDYILDDLCEFAESHYPLRRDRAGRAIAGIGMGATGTAVLAFTHPDYFCVAGVHSPVMFTIDHPGPPWIFGLGDEDALALRDPVQLAATLDPAISLQIYIDSADGDADISASSANLHYALIEQDIPHSYVTRPGANDPAYWRSTLAHYLGFYAAGW